MVRFRVLKWFLVAGFALGGLGASGCALSFDRYEEGDVCKAGRDAGIRLSTATDPVLRGCNAGPEREPDPDPTPEGSAGAAGAADAADAADAAGAEDSP